MGDCKRVCCVKHIRYEGCGESLCKFCDAFVCDRGNCTIETVVDPPLICDGCDELVCYGCAFCEVKANVCQGGDVVSDGCWKCWCEDCRKKTSAPFFVSCDNCDGEWCEECAPYVIICTGNSATKGCYKSLCEPCAEKDPCDFALCQKCSSEWCEACSPEITKCGNCFGSWCDACGATVCCAGCSETFCAGCAWWGGVGCPRAC